LVLVRKEVFPWTCWIIWLYFGLSVSFSLWSFSFHVGGLVEVLFCFPGVAISLVLSALFLLWVFIIWGHLHFVTSHWNYGEVLVVHLSIPLLIQEGFLLFFCFHNSLYFLLQIVEIFWFSDYYGSSRFQGSLWNSELTQRDYVQQRFMYKVPPFHH